MTNHNTEYHKGLSEVVVVVARQERTKVTSTGAQVPVPAAAPRVSATRKQTTQRRKAPTAEVVTQHR